MVSMKSLLFVFILLMIVPNDLNQEYSQITARSSTLPWNLQQIYLSKAWDITTGSTNVTIAVIDTGVDFSHPAISGNRWINTGEIANNSLDDDKNGYTDDYFGWDWVNQDSNPGWQVNDEIHHHGTFIAGILAANDSEVIGISPQFKVMALRVVDKQTLIPNPQGMKEAVDYAVQKNASVILMSLDLLIGPPGFLDSIRNAISANIPVVGVSGNSEWGNESVVLPARFSEVIAVGASNSDGEKAEYSNIGEELEILAPGGQQSLSEIKSTSIGGSYRYGSGTSYAAPHVAGIIGLIRSIRTDLQVEDIRFILRTTAQDIGEVGWDEETGFGIINASAALELAQIFEGVDSTTTSHTSGFFRKINLSLLEVVASLIITIIILRKHKKISS